MREILNISLSKELADSVRIKIFRWFKLKDENILFSKL